jgi:hypothetical protein
MSLINKINNKGPNIEPCGTPVGIGLKEDKVFLYFKD